MKRHLKKAAAIAAAAACAVSAVPFTAYALETPELEETVIEDVIATAYEMYMQDENREESEKARLSELLSNDTVNGYFEKIVSDMSWYTSKTEYISMQDVTGDGIPEFIVTDNYSSEGSFSAKLKEGDPYNTKTMRKFYSLEGESAALMYAVSMSRNYLTKAEYNGSDKGSWLYSDFTESLSENGSYEMNREYGIMFFGENKVTKFPKFSAYENVDSEADTFSYSYKQGGKSYANEEKSGYSKKKKALSSVSSRYYTEWYKDAGMWEYRNFEGDTTYLLEAVPTFMLSNLDGYGLCAYSGNEGAMNRGIYGINGYDCDYTYDDVKYHKAKDSALLKMNIAEVADAFVNSPEKLRSNHYYKRSKTDETVAVYDEKPVIYLYPEKTEEVSVKLRLNGALGTTYPEYKDGWTVTASPDGTLTDKDGKSYYCLFWEGISRTDWDMSKGFVVKGSDTADFLREKLTYMGLNSRECNEFIIYWLPRMENNPYNLITFQTDKYEEAARLDVSPSPDSILRIFMVFTPLDSYTDILPQELETFERTGFTLVEWGGAEV